MIFYDCNHKAKTRVKIALHTNNQSEYEIAIKESYTNKVIISGYSTWQKNIKNKQMKKSTFTIAILLVSLYFISSCGGGSSESQKTDEASKEGPKSMIADPTTYDPKRGEGKYDETNVAIGALDASMAGKGKSIAATKCFSCHKITDEKLVGPGWKGVTQRRTPHWIMNFITNPDPMIDKDPEVQAQLELCLVRMPNQNLAEQEARDIVEFMRQNDGAK